MSDASPHLPARIERTLTDTDRRLRVLETRAATSGGDSAWTYPTLNSGYTTRTTNPIRYRKDAAGVVHLAGAFTATILKTGQSPFTLPTGYRPGGSASGGSALDVAEFFCYRLSSSSGPDRLSISPDGTLSIPTLDSNWGLELTAISFYAEN